MKSWEASRLRIQTLEAEVSNLLEEISSLEDQIASLKKLEDANRELRAQFQTEIQAWSSERENFERS
jgi:hypothetical protein